MASLGQFLDTLDFVRYEKEVIIYLAGVSVADASEVYKNCKVPQGRIYSVLNGLKQKGVVNVIPTSPKKYEIKDVRQVLKHYVDLKKASLLEKKAQIGSLDLKPKIFQFEKNTPSVALFTGREEHLQALISLRNTAKKEILQIAPLFIGTFASTLSLLQASKRGVKIKILVKEVNSSNSKKIKEILQAGIEIKYLNHKDLLSLAIKDGEEFLLGVQDHLNNEERLTLYSKNKALLHSLQETFYRLWREGKKVTIRDLK